MDSVHHIWCPLFSQEFQDLPDGAETTLTDLISRLKNENPRFMSLFDKHNKLDHEIARKEGSDGRGYNAEVVRMKKQKLQLKDEMLKILQQESVKEV